MYKLNLVFILYFYIFIFIFLCIFYFVFLYLYIGFNLYKKKLIVPVKKNEKAYCYETNGTTTLNASMQLVYCYKNQFTACLAYNS